MYILPHYHGSFFTFFTCFLIFNYCNFDMGNVYIELVNFGTRKEKNILNNKRGGGGLIKH